jgi:hypothetical protein
LHLTNVTKGSEVIIKVSYYDDWSATASNGIPATITPLTLDLPLASVVYMEVPIFTSGTYNITLTYGHKGSTTAGDAISGITLILTTISMILVAIETRYDLGISAYLASIMRKATSVVRTVTSNERLEDVTLENRQSASQKEQK